MQSDYIIRGGLVYDGTGQPPRRADIALSGDRIVALGELPAGGATHEINARGLAVAPGFIDVHTHDDRALLTPGAMLAKVSQGVTTVVTGNCGLSLAPAPADTPIPAPLDLIAAPGWLRFPRFADYLFTLEQQGIAVNAACLVGHTTLRAGVMGSNLAQPASAQQCQLMSEQLEQALAAGAFGLSTGTFYPPARAADIEEIVAVGQPLARYHGLYVTHMRNEAEAVIDSLEETFAIGRRLGVRVVISHHKIAGVAHHGRSVETLARISQAMAEQDVSLDCYPYNASSTTLNPTLVARAASVLVSWSTPYPEHAGKTLAEVAALWGCDDQQAAARLMPAGAIYFMMDEADVQRILAFGPTMIGSDGMPHDEHPHPRLWATFPRVLGHYARDVGLFSLETAVHKMSGLTASELGIVGRGRLEQGNFADLVIFDPQKIADSASFAAPKTRAAGIGQVWINGQQVYDGNRMLTGQAGRVLRRYQPG